jgi:transposase
MRYLRELVMPHDAHKAVLEEYMQAIDSGIERVARLVDRMKQLLADWEWEPVVRALMACKGFQEVAAMTVISELGDLRRFSQPRAQGPDRHRRAEPVHSRLAQLLQTQLHLQGGAGAVSVGQAAGEVVLLEAMEATAHAPPQTVGTGSRSRNGAHGDAEPQRLLADEPE